MSGGQICAQFFVRAHDGRSKVRAFLLRSFPASSGSRTDVEAVLGL